ncbi:hypothetical protein XELAEV_18000119mg [Xenopus laevis]|uniref:Uncharacterized protein n=1 Tax=Xenopus laevis TaxID=8355 RepID=A0A974GYM4_XENLA|nr:hypothetical protein XELAEV_18000119mg [Xenopus laevis]
MVPAHLMAPKGERHHPQPPHYCITVATHGMVHWHQWGALQAPYYFWIVTEAYARILALSLPNVYRLNLGLLHLDCTPAFTGCHRHLELWKLRPHWGTPYI